MSRMPLLPTRMWLSLTGSRRFGKTEIAEREERALGRKMIRVVVEERFSVAIGALAGAAAESGFEVDQRSAGSGLDRILEQGVDEFDVGIGCRRRGAWVLCAGNSKPSGEHASGGDLPRANSPERVEVEAGNILEDDDLFAGGLKRADGLCKALDEQRAG